MLSSSRYQQCYQRSRTALRQIELLQQQRPVAQQIRSEIRWTSPRRSSSRWPSRRAGLDEGVVGVTRHLSSSSPARSAPAIEGTSPGRGDARHSLRTTLLEELQDRGFVAAVTSDKLATELEDRKLTLYCGADPSAPSLHVGNLLPLMCMLHFNRRGHRVLALIGGATGSIGDPSGRSTERNALASDVLDRNVAAITAQVERFFDRGCAFALAKQTQRIEAGELKVLNNRDWYEGVGVLDFLRDVGKYARVNTMMARDSVRNRLNSDQGISFTEFSYQLLQAYDFKVLHERLGCSLQLGGSDQWGNIVAGIDLIKRTHSKDGEEGPEPAYGLTIPLLTTSSGEKFGKSAGNAVWLDEKMTSVLDFYQYFLRTPDADLEKLLRLFTFLPLPVIDERLAEHRGDPAQRRAQQLLASEVTELVHGADGLKRAKVATRVLFQSDVSDLAPEDVLAALKDDARLVMTGRDAAVGSSLTKLAVTLGLVKSRAEANRAVAAGGFYFNGAKMTDKDRALTAEDLVGGRLALLAVGKTEKKVLYLE